ncbi:S-layer homology domain protein [Lachnospiraceae bacterium KM106-2]|nr:S-layer homology domain protein [Lachnospiraceae bacterium KM106-2]
MEKYDNIVKGSEIRKLVEKKMYQKALAIIDTMDLSKIRVMTDLSVFAEVFIQTERYEDAKDLLLRLHDRTKSRRVVYQLIRLAIKEKNIEDAEYYYEEYVHIAPKDSEKYLLRYRIDRMKGEDVTVLIQSLEALKEHDYIEKWSYELAKLYHVAGMKDQCVRECSDIILWFGEGIIVEKAKLLKEYYVGKPKHIEAIKTAEKKAIEEKTGMLATKDLSKMTENLNKVLDEIEKDEQEEIVEENKEQEEKIEISVPQDLLDELAGKETKTEVEDKVEDAVEETVPETVEEVAEETAITEEPSIPDEIEESVPLFEKYNELFETFTEIESVKIEICKYTEKLEDKSGKQHVMISGTDEKEKLLLAKQIAKMCHQEKIISSTKIAKINAHRVNRIDLSQNYDKITDSCIIVEEAGALSNKAVVQLIMLIEVLKEKVIVILEDTREGIEKLQVFPQLLSNFESHIHLKNDLKVNLLELALKDLALSEYHIQEEAKTILEQKLQAFVADDSETEMEEKLHEYMRKVIKNADERNMSQLKDVVSDRNYLHVDLNEVISEDIENV